jgi:hypothetical protein
VLVVQVQILMVQLVAHQQFLMFVLLKEVVAVLVEMQQVVLVVALV